MTIFQQVRDALARKSSFYRAVFNPETLAGKEVLTDLAEFCRAHEPTFHTDPRLEGVLQGRREVWLRIQKYSRLPPDLLAELQLASLEAKKNPGG